MAQPQTAPRPASPGSGPRDPAPQGGATESSGRKRARWLPRIRFADSKTSAALSASATFYFILFPALLLGAFGLLMGFSATSVSNIAAGVNPYRPFLRTLGIAAAALAAGAVATYIPVRFWDRFAVPIYLLGIGFQLLVIPFGVGQGGNMNWVRIPGLGQMVQPSEFLKLATCLILARVLSSRSLDVRNFWQVLFWAGLPAAGAMGAVMIGSDMGTMLIFVALTGGALWMAGIPGKWFGAMGVVGAGALVFMVAVSPSRVRRVLEFLPGYRPAPSTSAPTQTDHGLWALGSGGLTGLGAGVSREKWDYLQEGHTDFILAIIGEEFGLLGTLTLLVVFGALVFGIFQMAASTTSPFIRIASGGIGTWLLAQALINVGTVVGLVPVIGVPFPLVSHGGSSFLFTAMAIGVLLSFARYDLSVAASGEDEVKEAVPR